MVYVLYYKESEKRLESSAFESFLNQLPLFVQQQVMTYYNWQDQQRCLIGKTLLLTALQTFFSNPPGLHKLWYNPFRRPYIDEVIDFNIAHAGDYTLCAISKTEKVGIDIEKVVPFQLNEFSSVLSKAELHQLASMNNPQQSFYRLWTQKEAFIKAIGTGLHTPLNEIGIENNRVIYAGHVWFLKELHLNRDYCCHLCTSSPDPLLIVKEICFLQGKALLVT